MGEVAGGAATGRAAWKLFMMIASRLPGARPGSWPAGTRLPYWFELLKGDWLMELLLRGWMAFQSFWRSEDLVQAEWW